MRRFTHISGLLPDHLRVRLDEFNEDQPRDEQGRFGSGGGSSSKKEKTDRSKARSSKYEFNPYKGRSGKYEGTVSTFVTPGTHGRPRYFYELKATDGSRIADTMRDTVGFPTPEKAEAAMKEQIKNMESGDKLQSKRTRTEKPDTRAAKRESRAFFGDRTPEQYGKDTFAFSEKIRAERAAKSAATKARNKKSK